MFPNSEKLANLLDQLKGDFNSNMNNLNTNMHTERERFNSNETNSNNLNEKKRRPKSANFLHKKNYECSSNVEIYNQPNKNINNNKKKLFTNTFMTNNNDNFTNNNNNESNFNLNKYKFSLNDLNNENEDIFTKTKNTDKYLQGDEINEEKLIHDYRLSLNKELLRRLFEEREKENLRENVLRTTRDLNERKNLEKRYIYERSKASSEIIMINE